MDKETLLTDSRVDGLARLLVNYCVAARPGDWVLIRADLGARPLVERIHACVLAAGSHATVLYHDEELEESLYPGANADQ